MSPTGPGFEESFISLLSQGRKATPLYRPASAAFRCSLRRTMTISSSEQPAKGPDRGEPRPSVAMTPKKPRSSRPGRMSFGTDAVRINITAHDQVSGAAKDPHRTIINLGSSDIHADYERLKANGVTFVRPPEKEGWGGYTATFKDVDGNLVNILQTA